jgi:hypothetical protein
MKFLFPKLFVTIFGLAYLLSSKTYRRIESRRGWYGRTSWGEAARSPPSALGSFQT